MFVFFNQLRSGDPICIDVNNIREYHPEEIDIEGETKKGTLIALYRGGDPWIVKQSCYDVHQACRKAKRGES